MKRLLLLAGIFVILAIAGIMTLHILADREHVIADARYDVENLRDALSEQTRQTFAALEIALDGVSGNIDPTALRNDDTYRTLSERQDSFAPTFAIFILDQEGRLAASSRTRDPNPVDFSEDPMFTAHRDDPSQDLFIAKPRKGKVGYAKDQWIVNVSQRLTDAEGNFTGIVAAAVSIDYLTDFYDALRMGDNAAVGISGADGTVIARSPFNEDYLGRELTDTKLYQEMLPTADAGVYRAHFVTDGIERIIAYSRVPDYPIVVYVGVALEERLASWQRRVLVDGAIGLLAIAIMGGFGLFLMRRINERQEEQDKRVEQLTRLTEISTALLESPDVTSAVQRATDMARVLVPCHQALTSLIEPPSLNEAIRIVSLSDKYAAWRDYDEQLDGSGLYRLVCESNQPMRLTQAELEAHPAWKGFGAAKDRHPPMRGWLAVPLVAEDGSNIGLIQLSDRERGEFTDEDQALMVELAHVTSVAIQRLKMANDLRQAAVTADRLRAEAEEARTSEAEARKEMEKVLTSIRDAVYALDSEWRFTYLNRQAEVLLERNAEELIGRNVWHEFPITAETELHDQYHRALKENVDVEFQFYSAPLKRHLEVRAFPQAEGGLTVYFQDVSDWVIQEEQLRQAQKMEAVGQLTGGVAHDFNNLLTVILGNAEAVLDNLDKEAAHYRLVSMIVDAADRAGDLTQRLLAFSRRQPLEPKAVDINALVNGLDPLLRRTLGEAYDIEFICQDGIDKAVVDPGQLENAIVNLAVNARDAMLAGGRLTIETGEVWIDDDYIETHIYAKPGRYIMIAVGDGGSGMSPEVRAHAFEPFYTTKASGEGTGLGLSMVYGFVKQSKGHINIYSELGEGTTIKLYLPRASPDDKVESQQETEDAIQRGTERILVVEDDTLVREFTTATLTSLGYDVTAVADGTAAKALLETDGSFDLLLCDVVLGGDMNGRQVAEAAHALLPHLKVLYMSGYTENAIVHHGRLDPGARLLQKPFRRADLAMKVREALDNIG
ncbi:MAG: ATP-binding protein [Pseudomonadota bacterium]